MDYTPVLLVTLAIAWGAAGLYWLRTRSVAPSLSMMPSTPRRRPMGLPNLSMAQNQRANVLPLRGGSTEPNRVAAAAFPEPGHSLSQPARRPTGPSSTISSEQARLRRRNVLLGLAGAALLTLIGAATIGGSLIIVHLLVDALLLGYVLLLVQYQREIELDRTQNLPVYAEAPRHLAATGTEPRRAAR